MWLISRLRDHRYCAFCKHQRRVYLKKHVDLTNVACALAISLVTTYAVWASADPQGLFIFSVYIVGAEIFVHTRWRVSLVCKMCGFDPVLYKRSPERASARVREFFKEQVDNPEFWLTRSPLLQVQREIRAKEKKALERQIILNRSKSTASSLAPTKTL
jgi:hypothetical protein